MLAFLSIKLDYVIVLLLFAILAAVLCTNIHKITWLAEAIPEKMPNIFDPNLKAELIFESELKREGGTLSPVSTMAFLGINDILILDKNHGTVNRIVNGVLLEEPLIDVSVANKRERGLLGIDTFSSSKSSGNKTQYVFLYYTESVKDGNDVCPISYYCEPGNDPIGNRLYRYEINGNKLANPKLLLNLPALPGPIHNGGVVKVGPDNNVYVTIGDVLGYTKHYSQTRSLNFKNGTEPDGRAGILRVTIDGKSVNEKGILGDKDFLKFYYAYGIRNSFGIDFDPVTGKLWDTENGPDYGDEINIVEPGFNSGWNKVQGYWVPIYNESRGGDFIAGAKISSQEGNRFVDFGGKGKYSAPEFTWNQTAGPTAIKFLETDIYGKEYKNDLLVADINNGYLYHFNLNKDRTGLSLPEPLKDKIANNLDELKGVILGDHFGVITDMDIGPDGYLYILSHHKNNAEIFKIMLK